METEKKQFDQKWFNRDKKDYETPDEIFIPLNDEFCFTLDVASNHENAKCKRHFTEENNGLLQEWDGICWMNPPFGRVIKKWVKPLILWCLRTVTTPFLHPS